MQKVFAKEIFRTFWISLKSPGLIINNREVFKLFDL